MHAREISSYSDGLEPSTPSLPSQSTATRFGLFLRFFRPPQDAVEDQGKRARSARSAEAPERRKQWIGRAFDQTNQPRDEWSRDAHNEERGCEPDEATGRDVKGVVRADEDTSSADNGGRDEEDRTDDAVEEEDGERDRERSARVIAWEGGVMGAAAPDVGGRVRGERSRAVPDLADQLVDQ